MCFKQYDEQDLIITEVNVTKAIMEMGNNFDGKIIKITISP